MYLHTTSLAHDIPATLAAYSSVINVQLSRPDVTEELLDRFMMKEKQRLNDEKDALMQVCLVITATHPSPLVATLARVSHQCLLAYYESRCVKR